MNCGCLNMDKIDVFILVLGLTIHVQAFDSRQECIPGTYHCYILHEGNFTYSEAKEKCIASNSVAVGVYDSGVDAIFQNLLSGIDMPVWTSGRREDPRALENNDESLWRTVDRCAGRLCTNDQLKQHSLERQGCYEDYTMMPDLDTYSIKTDNVTMCHEICKEINSLYSGMSEANICTCGENFGSYGTSYGCTIPCEPGYNCGGYGKNFIYKITGSTEWSIWGYDQPDNAQDTEGLEFCVFVDMTKKSRTFYDGSCFEKNAYICSFNNSFNCPGSPFFHRTQHGCIYSGSDVKNWYHARATCWLLGGELITFKNESMFDDIFSIVNGTLAGHVHIGIYREVLVWDRQYREVEMEYYNFAPDHPDLREGDCIALDPEQNLTWISMNCDERAPVICYVGPDMDPEPTTLGPSTTDDWTTMQMTNTPLGSISDGNNNLTTTDKILIGVLVPLGVILIILLILLLCRVCRKNEKDKVAPVTTDPEDARKEKIDARMDASKPQSGPIGDVDEGYYDMGSTANLIYSLKTSVLQKWKKVARRSTKEIVENRSPMTSRRRNSREQVFVPDLTSSPFPDGLYIYEGDPEITRYIDPVPPQFLSDPSYGSLPGQTDTREDKSLISLGSAMGDKISDGPRVSRATCSVSSSPSEASSPLIGQQSNHVATDARSSYWQTHRVDDTHSGHNATSERDAGSPHTNDDQENLESADHESHDHKISDKSRDHITSDDESHEHKSSDDESHDHNTSDDESRYHKTSGDESRDDKVVYESRDNKTIDDESHDHQTSDDKSNDHKSLNTTKPNYE